MCILAIFDYPYHHTKLVVGGHVTVYGDDAEFFEGCWQRSEDNGSFGIAIVRNPSSQRVEAEIARRL